MPMSFKVFTDLEDRPIAVSDHPGAVLLISQPVDPGQYAVGAKTVILLQTGKQIAVKEEMLTVVQRLIGSEEKG
jgi:hypothetical protein